MRSYKNLVAEVQDRLSDTNTLTEDKIKKSMNIFYKQLWLNYNWRTIIDINRSFTISSGATNVLLPKDLDVVYAITERDNENIIKPQSTYSYSTKFIDTVKNAGIPKNYTRAGFSPLGTQPSSNGILKFSSSSASDTTQTIRVWGKDATTEEVISEAVTLSGASVVSTTSSFLADSITEISKSDTTTGIITIYDASDTVLDRIDATEYNNRYIKIALQAPADSIYTAYVSGRKRYRSLIYDEDIPAFDCGDALVEYAFADRLESKGDDRQAAAHRQIASGIVDSLIGVDINDESFDDTQPEMEFIENDIARFNRGY